MKCTLQFRSSGFDKIIVWIKCFQFKKHFWNHKHGRHPSPSSKTGPGKMQKSCKREDLEHFGLIRWGSEGLVGVGARGVRTIFGGDCTPSACHNKIDPIALLHPDVFWYCLNGMAAHSNFTTFAYQRDALNQMWSQTFLFLKAYQVAYGHTPWKLNKSQQVSALI